VKEPETKTDGRWLKPGQTAYIHIPSFFYPSLEDGALGYVNQFRAAQALIIDVRKNPGGLQPMRLLKALMDHPYRGWKESTVMRIGMLQSYERSPQSGDSKGGVPDYFKGYTDALAALGNAQLMLGGETVAPSQPIFHGRLIILIDGGCISACEDLVEPFKDNGRATLVGETTQGSAGLPYGYDFHNGMSLKIAVKREYFPDGSEFEGVGIKPDIEVHPTIDDLKNGRDPVLDKALELAAKP
jgi:carboxyl-terminal processing protease